MNGGRDPVKMVRSVLSEAAGYSTVEVAQQALAIAVAPVLLFFLSPEAFGVITWAVVVAQGVTTIASLGLDFALLRLYYQFPEQVRPSAALSTALVSMAAAVLVGATATALVWRFSDDATRVPLSLAALAGGALAVRAVPLAWLRVTSAVRTYAYLTLGGAVLQAVAQVALVATGGGPTGFMVGYAVPPLLTATVGVTMLVHATGGTFRFAVPAELASFAARAFPAACFNRLVASADRVTLFAWGDFDALGLYGAAARFAAPLKLLTAGLKMALAPALSRGERDRADPMRLFERLGEIILSITIAAAAAILLATVFMHFTPWAPRTTEFQWIVALLLFAHVLGSLVFMAQIRAYYSRYPMHASLIAGANAISLGVGLPLLVPAYGASGAALAELASAAATVTLVIGMHVHSVRRLAPWGRLSTIGLSFGPTLIVLAHGFPFQGLLIAIAAAVYGFVALALLRRSWPGAVEAQDA